MNTLHGIDKNGNRMMFNFDAMEWQTVQAATKSHKYDGSVMARIAAEVNAQVHCLVFTHLQVVYA